MLKNQLIGIDIGVGGTGIAVKDDNGFESVVIKHDLQDPNSRKTYGAIKRGRRPLRRKILRVKEFEKLCSLHNLPTPENTNDLLVKIKNKALHDKIEELQLINILKNYLTHRGSTNLKDYSEDDIKEFQSLMRHNQKLLAEGLLPCEIQKMNYDKVKNYRGNKVVFINGTEKHFVMNTFPRESILREITLILEKQKSYNEKLTDGFIDSYLELFKRMRNFTVGPGNEKSRTDNGIYTTKKDPVTGKYITLSTNIEKMIGKCSLFIDQTRASKASFSAQKFNLMNDLLNMKVSGRPLDETERKEIFERIVNSTDGESIRISSIVSKVTGIKKPIITGVGVKKEKDSYKNVYHTMAYYRGLVKEYMNVGIGFNYSENEIDDMMFIINLNSAYDQMKKDLLKFNKNMSDDEINLLYDFKKNNSAYFGWHAYSVKALRFFIEKMVEEGKNPYHAEKDYNLGESQLLPYKGKKTIPLSVVEDIPNPVVKKNVRHVIKFLNTHIKEHGYPEAFVIEAARDYNAEKEKARIEEIQAKNRGETSRICDDIFNKYGIQIKSKHFANHKSLGLKLKLWDEQGGYCPYTLNFIHPKTLILNPDEYEVDHIIPYVLSLDNSRENIVLVESHANSIKGIRSPLSYIRSGDANITEKEFRKNIKELKLKKGKEEKLLSELNFSNKKVRNGFLNSHLNNTRYIITVLSGILRKFIKANNLESKVVLMNPKIVTGVRNSLNIDKDRLISDDHHATDAMIMLVAYERLKKVDETYKGLVDYTTGKVYSYNRMHELRYDVISILREYDTDRYKEMVLKASENIRYKDHNKRTSTGKLFNDTSYGVKEFKGENYTILKLSNIYETEGRSCAYESLINKINKGNEEHFLMYHHDPKTFELIKSIIADYDKSQFTDAEVKEKGLDKNPFYNYLVINGHPIFKSGTNIPVKNLRLYDKKLGSHFDLSHKIGHNKGDKKQVKLSLNPYRSDIYYNKKTKAYEAVGLKLVDLTYHPNGNYIPEETYENILKEHGVLKKSESLKDLKNTDFEFRFSLYSGDHFKTVNLYEKGETLELIFKSKDVSRERIGFKIREQKYQDLIKEIKGIEKVLKDDTRLLKYVTKMVKINKDSKGRSHYTTRENLKNIGKPLSNIL